MDGKRVLGAIVYSESQIPSCDIALVVVAITSECTYGGHEFGLKFGSVGILK